MTNAELLALFTAMDALHKNKLDDELSDVFNKTISAVHGKIQFTEKEIRPPENDKK